MFFLEPFAFVSVPVDVDQLSDFEQEQM